MYVEEKGGLECHVPSVRSLFSSAARLQVDRADGYVWHLAVLYRYRLCPYFKHTFLGGSGHTITGPPVAR